jgi:tricorn protease
VKTSVLLAALALPFLLAAAPVQARERIQLGNNPALSPDGSLLAFDWNGDIWVVPTNGGNARQLTQNPARDSEPRFSPDGKEIAFISTRDGTPQVYVVPVEGGTAQQLTFHSAGSSLMEWLPDGHTLLVSGGRDHYWRHAERFFQVGRNQRLPEVPLFDDYGSSGTVSPDGKRLLFTRETEPWWRKGYHGSQASQIWLYDLETKTPKQLIAHDRGARWPLWQPDGKGFYYVGGEGGSYNLREFNLAAGTSRALTHFDQDDAVVFPCISRDGSTLVFRRLFDFYLLRLNSKDAPAKLDIFVDNDRVLERKERRVLSTATQVAFSADGLEMAFIAGGDLWVMDTELREPVQVTNTSEDERDPVWSPDGDALFFVSDKDGQSDIYRAERGDAKQYWFLNRSFKVERLTNDAEMETDLRMTPDGKLAFIKGRGDLWVMSRDGKDAKVLVKSWSRLEFDFSPDGKWLAYAIDDTDFNRDIWLVPVDGSKPPYNLTRNPNPDGNPRFSPDGKLLAFTGRRGEKEVDIHYVWLRAEDDERTSRERSLDKALDKLGKSRPKTADARKDDKPDDRPADKPADKPSKTSAPPEVVIDFEGITERIHRVSIPNSTESDLMWSSDSKKLAFVGTANNERGLYTIEFPDSFTPQSLTTTPGTQMRWLKNGQIVGLANGVPAVISGGTGSTGSTGPAAATAPTRPGGRGGAGPRAATPTSETPAAPGSTTYKFQARQEVDLGKKYAAAFDSAWRTMRDNWYDEKLGNRDWNGVRVKYHDMASHCVDTEMLATVINLMLGELNGSHLGFTVSLPRRGGAPGTPPATPTPTPTPTPPGAPVPEEPETTWRETTAHLGVRFVDGYAGPGLKVRDVLPGGPADQKKSKIEPSEILLAVDGKEVNPQMDLTEVLNGPLPRDVLLKVRSVDGKEREVTMRPISYAPLRGLLRDKWLADNRKLVEKLSENRLGYLHISAMDMPSFYKFQEELYAVGYGKEGLVIDVRENGGGSTADHLLTALTQPVHAIAVPRGGGPGYPSDRKVYATWNKPIVVLCNQNSFSNAEIFSHAIKTLKRGQLVGVPTAGGVVSTGAAPVMDIGVIRLPFRGWHLLGDGQDMELNGAVPDHIVWPGLEELPKGKDVQIEKAVAVLLEDVKADQAKPKPKLIKATDRPPQPVLDHGR